MWKEYAGVSGSLLRTPAMKGEARQSRGMGMKG